MREIVAIIVGVIVLNIIPVPENIASRFMKPSFAYFIGCFIAGFITRKNGLLYGVLVSVISFAFLIISLLFIAYKASGGYLFFPKERLIYSELVAILWGMLGGYLGEKSYKLLNKTKCNKY
jgi:uncharacterized membrane protein